MKRDITGISRDLDSRNSNDIIYKKDQLMKMFNEDPDLKEVLGEKHPRPLNKFLDSNNPTEEELKRRQEIMDYNAKIQHEQIVPWIKLNDVQKEVLNFIMFDITDTTDRYGRGGKAVKNQLIEVYVVVHEDDMMTEYGITRTDLLSYIIRDLLCWTNAMGRQWWCYEDKPLIIDGGYYARRMRFFVKAPNVVNGHMGTNNFHDDFSQF
jgi:hypothetical protein